MYFGLRTKPFLPIVLLTCTLSAFAFTPVAARHGMVASSEPLASDVGVQILRAGGNAVDAAVAVGFALAVTHPVAGNIGGGGFMLVRLAKGEAVVVDYREAAPAAASRNMYINSKGELLPDASTVGALAAGVPGTVAGLVLAEQKYGKLGLAVVMAPAIHLALDGFEVSYNFSESLRRDRNRLSKFAASRQVFLRDGHLYEPGEIFKQPELARTLEAVAREGGEGFYSGRVAQAIVGTMQKYHGLITAQDLAEYHPILRQPLEGHFRGYDVLVVPPPSSGGVALIEMLNVLDPIDDDRARGTALHRHFGQPVDMRMVPVRARRLVVRKRHRIGEGLARVDQRMNDLVGVASRRRVGAVVMDVHRRGIHRAVTACGVGRSRHFHIVGGRRRRQVVDHVHDQRVARLDVQGWRFATVGRREAIEREPIRIGAGVVGQIHRQHAILTEQIDRILHHAPKRTAEARIAGRAGERWRREHQTGRNEDNGRGDAAESYAAQIQHIHLLTCQYALWPRRVQ